MTPQGSRSCSSASVDTPPPDGLRRTYELLRTGVRGGNVDPAREFDTAQLASLLSTPLEATEQAATALVMQGVLRRTGETVRVSAPMVQIPVNAYRVDDPSFRHAQIETGLTVAELEHQVVQSTPIIRDRLETDAATVLMVEQIGKFEGQAIYVHVGYYAEQDPHELSRQIIVADQPPLEPIHVVFEKLFEKPFGTCETTIEAVPCEPVTAGILGIKVGTPVILRETLLTDTDGRPRSFSYTHYRADRVSMSDTTE